MHIPHVVFHRDDRRFVGDRCFYDNGIVESRRGSGGSPDKILTWTNGSNEISPTASRTCLARCIIVPLIDTDISEKVSINSKLVVYVKMILIYN